MPVQSRIRRELRILQVAGSPNVVPSLVASSGRSSTYAADNSPKVAVRTPTGTQAKTNTTKPKSKSRSKENNGNALSPTSANKIKREAQSLRRELAHRTDERAQSELELLNAVASLEEEKSALVDKLRSVTQQHDEATYQINNLTQQMVDMKRQSAVETNAHENTAQMLKIKSRDLDEAVDALELADQEVRRLKAKDEEMEAQSSQNQKYIGRLEAELGGDAGEMACEIERLYAALAEAYTNIRGKDAMIEGLNDELARSRSSKQKEIDLLGQQSKTLRHEIQVVNSVLCSTEKLNDELREEIEALKDAQTQQPNNSAVEHLRRELDKVKHRNSELESELGDHRATIFALQEEKVEVAYSIERLLQDITSGNSQLRAKLHAKEIECMALRGEMAALRGRVSFGTVITATMENESCRSPRIVMEPVATVSPDRDEIEPPSCGLTGYEAAQRLRDYMKEKKGTNH